MRKVRLVSGLACVKDSSLIGYCHCDAHKGYLTPTLMKSHKCLEKKCSFFQKYECGYFQAQENQKRHREKEKEKAKAAREKEKAREQTLSTLKDCLQEIAPDNVYITSCKELNGSPTVFFVTDERKKTNFSVNAVQVKLPNGQFAKRGDINEKQNSKN